MIKLKENTLQAAELSSQLRQGSGTFLTLRRIVLGLSMVSTVSMQVISLYQMGIIKHLPEPPLPHLDADKVDASPDAYAKLETPDAVLAIGSYAATMALTAMGKQDRAQKQPWIPLALAAKVGFDTFQAGKLTLDQINKQKAFCSWCLLAAITTALTVPLVIPEAYAAIRQLMGKSSS